MLALHACDPKRLSAGLRAGGTGGDAGPGLYGFPPATPDEADFGAASERAARFARNRRAVPDPKIVSVGVAGGFILDLVRDEECISGLDRVREVVRRSVERFGIVLGPEGGACRRLNGLSTEIYCNAFAELGPAPDAVLASFSTATDQRPSENAPHTTTELVIKSPHALVGGRARRLTELERRALCAPRFVYARHAGEAAKRVENTTCDQFFAALFKATRRRGGWAAKPLKPAAEARIVLGYDHASEARRGELICDIDALLAQTMSAPQHIQTSGGSVRCASPVGDPTQHLEKVRSHIRAADFGILFLAEATPNLVDFGRQMISRGTPLLVICEAAQNAPLDWFGAEGVIVLDASKPRSFELEPIVRDAVEGARMLFDDHARANRQETSHGALIGVRSRKKGGSLTLEDYRNERDEVESALAAAELSAEADRTQGALASRHPWLRRVSSAALETDFAAILAGQTDLRLVEMPMSRSGFFIPTSPDRGYGVIAINEAEAPTRKRFTLGHELTHASFSKGISAPTADHDAVLPIDHDAEEARADRRAAELLAPEEMVRRALSRTRGVVVKAAGLLFVSPSMLERRVRELRINPKDPFA